MTDTEVACDNLEDDDCDTLVDCDDDDCANDSICSFTCVATGAEICNDLQDNDCDEAFDCQDPDCAEDPACVTGCVSTVELVCNDGEDDDCDGFVDCDDEDCKEALNCLGACLPTGPEPDTPQGCSDTLDNNCDGFVDCMDSQCAPTASCCSPTVPATEVCNDGVDNNCDGIIDCPVIVNTFPPRPPSARTEFEGGAAAGHHVLIELAPPVAPDFVVQCRTAHRNQINTATFQVCNPDDPRGLVVHPISPEQAQDPALNGRLQTQVRYAYPNGAVSQIAVHTYYVHSSLANVEPCPPRASDEAFFEVAAADLDQGLGFSGNDARLAAPFVNIDFTPPISAIYEIAEGDGTIEVLSLRRRFVLHDSYRLLLMTRVYPSRRSGLCVTAMIRKHQNDPGDDSDRDQNRYARNSCDALVFNKAGAGVCLNVDSSGTPYLAFSPSSYWRINNSQFKSQLADNFMWRKLLRVNSANGTLKMFSPKCYAGGETCTGGDRDVLFLPDRDLFPALNP